MRNIRSGLFATLVVGLVVIAAAAGCKSKGGAQAPEAASDDAILFGSAAPLSGDQAQIGQDITRGVEIAIEDINRNGGLLGRKVELMKLDDRADPREASNAASKLAAETRVSGVIGHYNSGCSIPASVIYHRAGVVQITPASTADELTEQGYTEVFRTVLKNSDQGPAAAVFAREKLGAKKVAVIDDKSAYGKGIAEAFRKKAVEIGLEIVAEESFNLGDKDFSTLVTKLKAASPDAIYAGAMFAEGALLMRQGRPRGLKTTFISGDGFFAPKLMELGGEAVEGTVISFLAPPWDQTPEAQAFLKRYKEKYGEEVKSYAPLAYDATMVLAAAVRIAKSADRKAVLAVLHQDGFSHRGIASTYRFDKNGDMVDRRPYFYTVKEGKFVSLK
jgi:branched-chain amino acid transport system substrate-binding protein